MKILDSNWSWKALFDVIGRMQDNWKCTLNEMNSDRVTKKVYVGRKKAER